MSRISDRLSAFGAFRVDPANLLLLRDGLAVPLPPKAFQVLLVLLERIGDVVEKDELLTRVWPEGFVEENNVAQAVRAIRAALDDGQRPYRYVETIPGRGYRLSRRAAAGADASAGAGTGLGSGSAEWLDAAPAIEAATDDARAPLIVRPFRWLGEDAGGEADVIAPGLTDAMFTRLANEPRLRPVLASSSGLIGGFSGGLGGGLTGALAGSLVGGQAPRALALQGSLQHAAGRLRVSVQLVNVADNVATWGATFDEPFTNPLDLQDVLSARIAAAVMARLAPDARVESTRLRFDDRAYLAYQKGRYLLGRRTRGALLDAIQHFTQALETGGNPGPAQVGLAEAYTLLGEFDYMSAPQALAKARAAAQEALALGLRGEPYTSLAEARFYCDWDSPGAEREYRRAIALEPRYATAHHWYGWYLVTQRRFDDGFEELQVAHELDPLSLIITTDLGWALMCAEDYDRAVEHLQHAASLDPTFFFAPYYLGLAYSLQGKYEDAIRELHKAELIEDNPQVGAQLGFAYGVIGRPDIARERLRWLEARARYEYVSPYLMALIHAGIDDQEHALGWFTRAVGERSASLLWPGTKLIRPQLRSTPGIDRLLESSGFPS